MSTILNSIFPNNHVADLAMLNCILPNYGLDDSVLLNTSLSNTSLSNSTLVIHGLSNTAMVYSATPNSVLQSHDLTDSYIQNSVLSNTGLDDSAMIDFVLPNIDLYNTAMANSVLANHGLPNTTMINLFLDNSGLADPDMPMLSIVDLIRISQELGDDVKINKITKEATDDGLVRLVVDVTPTDDIINRCPHCGAIGKYRDTPNPDAEPKEWTGISFGKVQIVIRFKTQRITCPKCGKVVTAAVPWAYTKSRFTRAFEDKVVWLSLHMNKDAVSEFMDTDWESVLRCIKRVMYNTEGDLSARCDDLSLIGFDETSVGPGYNKFIMSGYNHVKEEVIWVEKGRSIATITKFFEALTEEQLAKIKIVTADGAEWIHKVARQYCPNVKICIDTFHVFQWITDATNLVLSELFKDKERYKNDVKSEKKDLKENLDELSQMDVEQLKSNYDTVIENLEDQEDLLRTYKYLITANPDNLNPDSLKKQKELLATDKDLKRIFTRIKSFREMMHSSDLNRAENEFNKFVKWCKMSDYTPFNKLSDTLVKFKEEILNTIQYKLTNGMVETTNNTIKFLIRQGYGYRNFDNLVTMIKFRCSKRYLSLYRGKTRRVNRSEWRVCGVYYINSK